MGPLLMWDESSNDILYTLESDISGADESVLTKIVNQISRFIDFLIKGVNRLIDFVKSLAQKVKITFNKVKYPGTIPDTYGYVEILLKTDVIIENYYKALIDLKVIDHSMQKSGNLVDEAKNKLVNNTVIGIRKQPSSRENYEAVTRLLQTMDEYDEELDTLMKPLDMEIPLKNPRLYSTHFLENEIVSKLKSMRIKLDALKKDLQISRDTYAQKSRLFKFMRRSDIERVNKMLIKTGNLITRVNKNEQICRKLLLHVIEYQNNMQQSRSS